MFIAITGALLLIALSNKFVFFLTKSAAGVLPITYVFKIMGLYIPRLASYLLPLGFFTAILFSFMRLHTDSEMTVMFSCGISWKFITKLVLGIAAFVAFMVMLLSMWLVPMSMQQLSKLITEGKAIGILSTISPGRFQVVDDGRMVAYIAEMDKNNVMQDIFIAEQPKNNDNAWTIITAESAKLQQNKSAAYMILNNGHRYSGLPGKLAFDLVDFAEYGREISQQPEEELIANQKSKTTTELWHSTISKDKAELQWRLALPISVIVLALLAISLSYIGPRQGRFAKFVPAILIYITYYNLLVVFKRWIAKDIVAPYIGMWPLHVIFLLIGFLLLGQVSGAWRQWRTK